MFFSGEKLIQTRKINMSLIGLNFFIIEIDLETSDFITPNTGFAIVISPRISFSARICIDIKTFQNVYNQILKVDLKNNLNA